MACRRVPREKPDESGVALFIVLGALAMLTYLVAEFAYVAQVSHRMAYEGLDQLKAFYLAKSAFKLQLLRLKAYQHVKATIQGAGGGANLGITPDIIEMIWRVPIVYPIPSDLPGLTLTDKDTIKKFMDQSSLQGSFSALIESESAKFNMNMLLAPFVPKETSGGSGASGATGGTGAHASPAFNPEAARSHFGELIRKIIQHKSQTDEKFQQNHRDLFLDDLIDHMIAWADAKYESNRYPREHPVAVKRMPYFTVSELHMLPLMEDEIYDVLAPSLTVSATPGINVNTMEETMLRALVSGISDEEVKEFFDYRDNPKAKHYFKTPDEYFGWLLQSVGIFHGDTAEMDRYRADLNEKHIRIVTEETHFRIFIRSQINQATRTLEAWVHLTDAKKSGSGSQGTPSSAGASFPGAPPPLSGPGPNERDSTDTGIQVTFMRII